MVAGAAEMACTPSIGQPNNQKGTVVHRRMATVLPSILQICMLLDELFLDYAENLKIYGVKFKKYLRKI